MVVISVSSLMSQGHGTQVNWISSQVVRTDKSSVDGNFLQWMPSMSSPTVSIGVCDLFDASKVDVGCVDVDVITTH